MRIGRSLLATTVALLAACATLPRSAPLVSQSIPAARPTLAKAAETFYAATDVASLHAAVASARTANPHAALYHELAAQLAGVEGQPASRFEHLVAALEDVDDDAPLFHLELLEDPLLTPAQTLRLESLCAELTRAHPNPAVRAAAALERATLAHVRGDDRARDEAMARVSGSLRLAIVGAWDNDQGKGFETVYPPENHVDLSAHYDGALLKVGWRREPPLDFTGVLQLEHLLSPSAWSLAYAAAGLQLPTEGSYELRVSSSDPLKVWVDDEVVFSDESVDGWVLDQLVLPVKLGAGPHRVLIKSAHRTGRWTLSARLTGPGGIPVAGLSSLPADTAGVPVASRAAHAVSETEVLEGHLESVPRDSLRAAYLRARWAGLILDADHSAPVAESYLAQAPRSVFARFRLVQSLWSNESGRAGDVLAELDHDVGEQLPSVPLLQAQRLVQQGLRNRAREVLLAAQARWPSDLVLTRSLAGLFAEESWTEDRCRLLERVAGSPEASVMDALARSRCTHTMGFSTRAERQVREVLEAWPRHPSALAELAELLEARGATPAAQTAAEQVVAAYPLDLGALERLARIQHHLGRSGDARATLNRAVQLNPDAAGPWDALGHLTYEQGHKEEAVTDWRNALDRNPKDEHLANRLDYLVPAGTEAWSADVPTEEDLKRAVQSRKSLQAEPNAAVAELMDDMVTELKPDGSSINVVSQVAHILNINGRDRFTHVNLGGRGRLRILHAYAVDARGERIDPERTSGTVIRFRKLDVGTTVVLQYRIDSPPEPLLSTAFVQRWDSQAANEQYVESRYVLWSAANTPLHEVQVGDYQREERKLGDERRVGWTARNVPPLIVEPAMPHVSEVNRHLWVSTVPDWDVFARWQAAVLEGVFRSSPELDALAKKLFADASTAEEKLARIQEYIEDSFRYEMDYGAIIDNWRPHPAPVVLEHRYGDCKDRAVLFYALAERAGLHVDFAILNTRNSGLVTDPNIPMPRFNHAIVYVPAQPGVATAHFVDPTTEGLDLGVLRPDDPGVTAFTYDPRSRGFAWHEIPFQAPTEHQGSLTATLRLDAEGALAGALKYQGRGNAGQWVRVGSREPESFSKAVQGLVGTFMPGSTTAAAPTVFGATDLRHPAGFSVELRSTTAVRKEKDQLRLRLPFLGSPEHYFALDVRKFPLVVNTPSTFQVETELSLPPGTHAVQLPTTTEVHGPCFQFERTVSASATAVKATQSITWSCARIGVAQYAEHRLLAQRVAQLLDEDVVVAKDAVRRK